MNFVAPVIEIGENCTDDIFMHLKIVLLTSEVNSNNVQFDDEFIFDVIENKDRYVGLPLVADIDSLINNRTLTHNLQDGKFLTSVIGVFSDFELLSQDGILSVLGTVRVFKRFPDVCEAILKLFHSEDGLSFSYEAIAPYHIFRNGVKVILKHSDNTLIGSCVVSLPALKNSRATLLVAQEGGDFVMEKDNIDFSPEEVNELLDKIKQLEQELIKKQSLYDSLAKEHRTLSEENHKLKKDERVQAIIDRYLPLFDEDFFHTDEAKKALDELDENFFKELFIENSLKEKPVLASRIFDNVGSNNYITFN